MSAAKVTDEAYVTLTTNDQYALGCLVLGHSLRKVQTTRQLVVMVTGGVSQTMRAHLGEVFDQVVHVDVLDSRDITNLALLDRSDLGVTFTKLHCWRLVQYKKCVFLDADTLVFQNVDELFDREELSAAHDPGWPDCFNSGVFVYKPNEETYKALLQFAVEEGSFDGGDQGLLNMFFKDWSTKDISRHLPFLYNVVSQAFYSYLPAFKQFGKDTKITHFIGPVKPWQNTYNTATNRVVPQEGTGHNGDYLQMWWNVFMECVQHKLSPSMALFLRFIHEEPILPPPLPSLSPPPSDQEPYYPQAPPEQEYHMALPYIPPELPGTSNDDFLDTTHEHGVSEPDNLEHYLESECQSEPEPIFVDVPQYREYSYYDSHYSEPPFSSYDTYEPATQIYESKDFFDNWSQSKPEESYDHSYFTTNVDGGYASRSDSCSEDIGAYNDDEQFSEPDDTHNDTTTDEKHEIIPAVPDSIHYTGVDDTHTDTIFAPDEFDVKSEDSSMFDDINDVSSDTDEVSEETESTVTEDSDGKNSEDTKIGLVGDLASLTIGCEGGDVFIPRKLTEQERREAWDRGQMDYMGEDRFDNILDQLLTTINEKPGDEVDNTAKSTKTGTKK